MNSVKISGLVLMGAFTLGVTSGSIVSATAGTEAVSGIAGEPQEDELTKLNNNGEDSINDSDNSEAETDASEDSDENKENIEGNSLINFFICNITYWTSRCIYNTFIYNWYFSNE